MHLSVRSLCYGLDGGEFMFDVWQWQKCFILYRDKTDSELSVQWVLRAFPSGVKRAIHFHIVYRSVMSGVIPPLLYISSWPGA